MLKEMWKFAFSSTSSSVLLAARADDVRHLRGRRRLRGVRSRLGRQSSQRRRQLLGRQRSGGLGVHPGDGHGRLLAGQDLIERRECQRSRLMISACCENGENKTLLRLVKMNFLKVNLSDNLKQLTIHTNGILTLHFLNLLPPHIDI